MATTTVDASSVKVRIHDNNNKNAVNFIFIFIFGGAGDQTSSTQGKCSTELYPQPDAVH